MKNLIVTAAGLSSRFEGLKPKWMLTHPKGNWMIVEALKDFDFNSVDKVYLSFLQEHVDKYNCLDAIKLCISELGIGDKTEIVLLDKQTDNQPHTVYTVIKQANIEGQIIIKEVDNYFTYKVVDGNYMCYYDLNDTTSINPSNKSYITIENNIITDIVEKKVVRQYKTLFVDLDGTLVKSSGKYTPPYWGETEGIKENIKFLNDLYDTGKIYIILTTARSSSSKEVTLKQLEREGIKYDNIIFDLFHANRTIINDYGTSNPYPTCDAVNLVRNSNELERFLKDLGK